MMIDRETPRPTSRIRKGAFRALIGGAVGYAAAAGLMRFLGSGAVGGLAPSATIAALVGVMYCVIAAGIIFGTANPRLGARFLNVEDADELREQRKSLLYSGAAMLLWGGGLIAVALAAPDGPLPQTAALIVGLAGLVAGTAISIPAYRASDELMLAVGLEGGAIAFGLAFIVFGLWGMFAHLGFIAGPQPLDLLTLLYVLVMLASFIAVGRRGMLKIK